MPKTNSLSSAERERAKAIILREATAYGLPAGLIEAQVQVESAWNPRAVSPCGAKGLLQLMPTTASETWQKIKGSHIGQDFSLANPESLFDPTFNITLGIAYLADQYKHFPEIPNVLERLKFSLASYNCGRGYINLALNLAREACVKKAGIRHVFPFRGFTGNPDLSLGPETQWQCWGYSLLFLSDPRCVIKDRRPDVRQVVDYVRKIIVIWAGGNSPEIIHPEGQSSRGKGGINGK